MNPLIECVPNFSDGRRPEVLEAIIEAMARAGGVYILDSSSDYDHNRSVVTLAGLPSEVEKAIWAGIRLAIELIDLTQHEGVHPRFGAVDVIPFIPLQDSSLADCVEIAHRMGRRVADELGLPVYFYEAAALRPDHQDLANIRTPSFQFEQLQSAIIHDPHWMPDMGPAELGSAGACLIGARLPLIAYNVYLNTANLEIAKKIARAIRHSSGGLRYVKSSGFLVNGQAQVSLNLSDYTQSSLHHVMEMIRREAARYGVGVESSELIGLMPENAMLESAAWYLQLDNFSPERVLEYRLRQAEAETTLLAEEEPPIPDDATSHIQLPTTNESRRPESFPSAVAQPLAYPGGGAVAGLVGALAAALAEMVAGLTIGRKNYAAVEEKMMAIQSTAYHLRDQLLETVEADILAVEALMNAIRQSQTENNTETIQNATLKTADIPLQSARLTYEALQLLQPVAELGNRNAAIDAAVGAKMALSALESAALNLQVNLLSITDEDLVARYLDEMRHLLEQARPLCSHIIEKATRRVGLNEVL